MPRITDILIDRYLSVFGAICIEGPKWYGKTMTSVHHSKSVFYLSRTGSLNDPLMLVQTDPMIAIEGDTPHLIDEWQAYPPLWDIIRHEVDARGEKGQLILTGSSIPVRDGIMHSGAGRFAKIKMRSVSLFESGDSDGSVSLKALFEGKIIPYPEVKLRHLLQLIT